MVFHPIFYILVSLSITDKTLLMTTRTILKAVLFAVFTIQLSIAQVGINTTTPAEGTLLDVTSTDKGIMIPKVSIADLSTIDPVTGVTATVPGLAAVEGMLVYNTNTTTGPGYFYWTGTEWANVAGTEEPPIDSVTLGTDYSFSPAPGYTDVPGMSITFTARKSSVLVSLTGSGESTNIAMSICDFEIFNDTAGASFGGTHQNMQTFDDLFGIAPAWSISFNKPLTGLTVGNTYTLKVRVFLDVSVTAGPSPALTINALSAPFHHHLTLSVLQ